RQDLAHHADAERQRLPDRSPRRQHLSCLSANERALQHAGRGSDSGRARHQRIDVMTGTPGTPFAPTSRYYGNQTGTYIDPNRTGGSPASGSRTRPHAFAHGTSRPSAVKRTSPSRNVAHVYVLRRFIPPVSSFATLEMHVVVQGERYDTLAASYIGDPTQFWRLADANGVADTSDLATPGKSISVTIQDCITWYAD